MPIVLISGDILSTSYHEARLMADDIVTLDPTLQLESAAHVESDWITWLNKARQTYGGATYQHQPTQPFIYHSTLGYMGSTEEMVKWALQTYSGTYHDPRKSKEYDADAILEELESVAQTEFQHHLEKQTDKSYAIMEFHIPGKDGIVHTSKKTAEGDIVITHPHRLIIELEARRCPRTVANFLALCQGTHVSASTKQPLHYVNCPIHRIVKDGWIQCGDVLTGKGDSGESIYGPYFEDESFVVKHDRPGVIAMSNNGNPHTNNSQFYLTLRELPSLNGKRVAFGRVIVGLATLQAINEVDVTPFQRPINPVVIGHSDIYHADVHNMNVSSWTRKRTVSNASLKTEHDESKKPTKQATLLIIGLESAGKSSVVKHWRRAHDEIPTPTVGFEPDTFQHHEYMIRTFGLGGSEKIRGYWNSYFDEVHAVVFVVDASDHTMEQMGQVRQAFQNLVSSPLIHGKPILIVANKQDGPDPLTMAELSSKLGVDAVKTNAIHIIKSVAKTGNDVTSHDDSLCTGLDWVLAGISKDYDALTTRVKADVAERKRIEKEKMASARERVAAEKAAREKAATDSNGVPTEEVK